MPVGKVVSMFILMPSHKLKDLFISNVKEILMPVMQGKFGRIIQPHECGGPQIQESYSPAQPYTGVRLWCRAQNSGKTSQKGNPIWNYAWSPVT